MLNERSTVRTHLSKLWKVVVSVALLAKLTVESTPTLDTEEVDILTTTEKRWMRQNHSAAEGLGVPGDYDQVKRLTFNFTDGGNDE